MGPLTKSYNKLIRPAAPEQLLAVPQGEEAFCWNKHDDQEKEALKVRKTPFGHSKNTGISRNGLQQSSYIVLL